MGVINLVYLAKPTRGGWPTYTAHLAYGLHAAGHDVQLWRLGSRTETRLRPFGRGLFYCNARPEYLAQIARTEKMHITAAEPSVASQTALLLRAGATITIHDPTELKGGMIEALQGAKQQVPVTVIRNVMHSHLKPHRINCQFVRHPYQRMSPAADPGQPVGYAAVFSRLDWDKGTHFIVQANKDLPIDKQVRIYGAENRLYTHHKLQEIDPDWRRNYHGPWPVDDLWGGARIAEGYDVVVDMSAIKGDGGGTQYTFLEGLDAGAALLLSNSWLTSSYPASNDSLGFATFTEPEKLAATLEAGVQAHDTTELFERHEAKARALETVGIA